MTRTIALSLLFLAWAISSGARLHAEELDGLDPATRKVFYNDQTVAVVRTELAGLESARIAAALRGMFYESRLPKVAPTLAESSKSADAALLQPRMLAGLGFTHVTTVAIDAGGGNPAMFQIVKLGPKLMDDDNFNLWRFGLTGLAKGTEVTKLGGYAVFHPAGTKLPAATGYQPSVEQVVLAGLHQPPATATVSWVMVPRQAVQELVKGMLGPESNWAALTSDVSGATYAGGYATIGNQPEIMIYVRFADEAKAEAMKQAYDAVWEKEIAKAAANDQQKLARIAQRKSEGGDTSAEEAELAKFPSSEETTKRFSAALPGKSFGHMFMLKMSQNHLRELTAVVMDAFQGKE